MVPPPMGDSLEVGIENVTEFEVDGRLLTDVHGVLGVVDGFVNLVGNSTHSLGLGLRVFQTGRIRQYVTFIAVSVVTLFVLLFALYPKG